MAIRILTEEDKVELEEKITEAAQTGGGEDVYILADGETIDDAPENADVVIDPNGEAVELMIAPASASVGQTIVVKAVDENGKPTEWEATDFPEVNGLSDGSQISALVETDMLPAVHDTDGKILTDENGNVILRY